MANAEDLRSLSPVAQRVTIRPMALTDARALAQLYTENREFLAPLEPLRPDVFYTFEGQRRHIAQLTDRRTAGTAYPFVITLGGKAVGAINLSNVVRGAFQNSNVGYWVAEKHNGQGVCTRALGLLCERAFTELGLHRIEAGTLPDNHGSQRVLEKNGFMRIGLAPRYLQIAGAWSDHILFQKTAD
ncbi:MAG TPA: GNAT family protein [Thermoleophilaceae bacterium]|nr:GNAT family protein [Thermoleophilaceae bacterium]